MKSICVKTVLVIVSITLGINTLTFYSGIFYAKQNLSQKLCGCTQWDYKKTKGNDQNEFRDKQEKTLVFGIKAFNV